MIKKYILISLNIIFSLSIFGQIYNPTFSRREVSNCDIVKIEKSSSNTIVYFKYKAPTTYINGGWICAGKDFFIRDCNTGSKYKVIKANNIPLCPEKHNFQQQGQTLDFNLVFPVLPSNTNKIDIIENETEGGFNFYGVNLTSSNNQTKETKKLKSDGKFRKTNNALSDIILIIPAGNSVNILSRIGGYYKVEYQGHVGYLSDLYFESTELDNKSSDQSNNSSGASSTNKTWDEYSEELEVESKNSGSFTNKTWDELSLKTHWKNNGIDKIEGIYEATGSYVDTKERCINGLGETVCYMTWRKYDVKYKLALLKKEGEYKLIYLSGYPRGSEKVGGCNCDGVSYIKPAANIWSVGDVKAHLYKTATPDFYKTDWYLDNMSLNSDAYISFDKTNYFKLIISGKESLYIKL